MLTFRIIEKREWGTGRPFYMILLRVGEYYIRDMDYSITKSYQSAVELIKKQETDEYIIEGDKL